MATKKSKNPGCYTIMFFHGEDTCTGLMFAPDEATARERFASWLPDCTIDRVVPGHICWDCYTLTADFEEQVGWRECADMEV